MLFSYEWLQEYSKDLPSSDTILNELTMHSVEVEEVVDSASALKNIVVGRLERLEKHPDADKLQVAHVNIGSEEEQVVCGGSNLREGMLVAFGKLGAQVLWHGEGEPVTLEEVKIRGVVSRGMICASDEIGLLGDFPKEDERTIVDLTERLTDEDIGKPLAEALGLQNALIDIDNKSMTHRADLFCHVGMAREIAAVFNSTYSLTELPSFPFTELQYAVRIDDNHCRRYICAELEVTVKPSPEFIQKRLQAAGVKVINNVVDITNYVMLEYGEPMHAFDSDKVHGAIIVRRAQSGETLVTLDKEEKKLTEDMLVIADEKKPLAVAGVIGGLESGVSENTQKIILEAANFEALITRKASQLTGVRTDSSMRWEKGLSPELAEIGMRRALELLEVHANANLISISDTYPEPQESWTVELPSAELTRLAGIEFSDEQVIDLLGRLECKVEVNNGIYTVTPPWFRLDLQIQEDLIEEVVRLYGVNNIPEQELSAVLTVGDEEADLPWIRRMRDTLKTHGLWEVYNYSMYGDALVKKVGIDVEDGHVEIANPLSADLQYMRTTLVPRMLDVLERNQSYSREAGIFEVGHVYTAADEHREIGIMITGQEAYRKVKGIVEALLESLNMQVDGEVQDAEGYYVGEKQYVWKVNGEVVATIGQLTEEVQENFHIEHDVAYARVLLPAVSKHASTTFSIEPLSQYPAIPLNLSVIVDSTVEWKQLEEIIREHAGELLHSLEVVDIYTGDSIEKGKKSMSFAVALQSQEKTLEMKEVEAWRDELMSKFSKQFEVTLRDNS